MNYVWYQATCSIIAFPNLGHIVWFFKLFWLSIVLSDSVLEMWLQLSDYSKTSMLLFGLINFLTEYIHELTCCFSKICSSNCLNVLKFICNWETFWKLVSKCVILWKFYRHRLYSLLYLLSRTQLLLSDSSQVLSLSFATYKNSPKFAISSLALQSCSFNFLIF